MKARTAAIIALAWLISSCAKNDPPDATAMSRSDLPDWSGIWVAEGVEAGLDGFAQIGAAAGPPTQAPPRLSILNATAPLTPEAKALVAHAMARGPDTVAQNPDGSDGWGYPLMMQAPPPLQFLITPDETLILNAYRDVRRIYTDGRPRPPEDDRWPPTTWGDSLGHWEGDTLVIETIDVREPRKYFGLSMPFTDNARYTERLRRSGPDRIEGEMTIEDPAILTQPMTIPLAYRRETAVDRLVLDAFGEDRTGFDGEFNTIEPSAQ